MHPCRRCHAPLDDAKARRGVCPECRRSESALMAAWCVFGMAVIVVVAVALQR